MLTASEIKTVEPNCVGLAAVHCPSTAIVDYSAVTEALAADVVARPGNALLLNHEVTALDVVQEGPKAGVWVGCKVRCRWVARGWAARCGVDGWRVGGLQGAV